MKTEKKQETNSKNETKAFVVKASSNKLITSLLAVGVVLLVAIISYLMFSSSSPLKNSDVNEVTITLEKYPIVNKTNAEAAIQELNDVVEQELTIQEEVIARNTLASAYILNGEGDKALAQYLALEESGYRLSYEDYITMAGIAERNEDRPLAVEYYSKALENLSDEEPAYDSYQSYLNEKIESLK